MAKYIFYRDGKPYAETQLFWDFDRLCQATQGEVTVLITKGGDRHIGIEVKVYAQAEIAGVKLHLYPGDTIAQVVDD